jgi:hypothetical protein
MNWQKISTSPDNKSFQVNGVNVFNKNFIEVLKFHAPGLAPVLDESGSYHIDVFGNELYTKRYNRTFGFYCNRAAVVENDQWFHINDKGIRAYSENFMWVGNFQENFCTVRDKDNSYYHINLEGNRIYSKSYVYAGDFKDGIACVKEQKGFYYHIDQSGKPINDKAFLDLGVFHKGFATARDSNGWFHIDKLGNELYGERYLYIEPFYNGYALVTGFDWKKMVIDETGAMILEVY